LSLAIAAALASPTAFAYNQSDAIEDCQSKIFDDSQYSRFSSPHDTTAQETGRNSYKVTGLVKDRDKKDHRFNCRIDHREVASWNVSPEAISDSDKKTAAAIGAGVLGLAILAAAVSGDKDHDNKRNAYEKGENSPFDDMGYLKQECANEVRRHLDRDHGPVRDLDLTYPHLNDRTLTGNGRVSFERGGRRELSFTCDFDRRGRVQDGHYSYADGGGDDRSSTSTGATGPSEVAKGACLYKIGVDAYTDQVSALKPGYWEIIMKAKSGHRKVACTVSDDGKISDWVEMK
jgi:hypothetical protein